ncbi:phage integrase SAM-like domain-containing protein [uncultured Alistipes sp.]|jgi:site-specific recombinase, phage integrase family|uniref:tyrosine-type recombinase/integrase n=1 Tax=uncultured Alistipes sp. TaxID=538949 RepID=UPI0025F337F6|nr:phage integrase SAM-like domain-containing protein [uncultured Alistipes sp.]
MKYTCVFYLDVKPKPAQFDKKGKEIQPYHSLDARIRINGRPLHYTTGYWIQIDSWRDEKFVIPETGEKKRIMEVRKNKYAIKDKKPIAYNFVNNDLRLIETSLFELSKKHDEITTSAVKEFLDVKLNKAKNKIAPDDNIDRSLWGLFEIFTKEPSVTEGRRKTYVNVYNNFKRFEDSRRRKIEFEDCTARLIGEFDEFLKNDDNSTGKYDDLSERHRPRPKGLNTRVKILRTLAAFFKWANKNYEITVNPFVTYKIDAENYDAPICLTKAERDLLYDFQPSKPYLERARDMFYVQCCVGCRVGDFFALTKDNLKNDGTLLEYAPQKTIRESSKISRVPLTSKVQTILAKYDLPDDRLLPNISPQKYNDYIGELLKEAKLNRKVRVVNKVTFKSELKPLHEVATSHSARKTFIDVLMKAGQSESVIGSMSGHVKGSKAFHRYYDVDDKQREDAIKGLE